MDLTSEHTAQIGRANEDSYLLCCSLRKDLVIHCLVQQIERYLKCPERGFLEDFHGCFCTIATGSQKTDFAMLLCFFQAGQNLRAPQVFRRRVMNKEQVECFKS